MLSSKTITDVRAREILDSRGNPTVQVKIVVSDGSVGVASVPSGASTGTHEALELRDLRAKRYSGKGVLQAVENVNTHLRKLVKGLEVTRQQDVDRLMLKLDGTPNKIVLGANAILGVSLACAHAGANASRMPLYRYLRQVYKIHYKSYEFPTPMMNLLNGGAHADWALDIQEMMVVPKATTMAKRVQMGAEIFHALGSLLKKKGFATTKGDEGGYAVRLKRNEQALELLSQAVREAGYKRGKDVSFAIDAAASEYYDVLKKKYFFEGKKIASEKLVGLYGRWIKKYGLMSVEDGLAEDDWDGWEVLTAKLGSKAMLVGDDLFVTNIERLKRGIDRGIANAILIKPNQIGTLTETIAAIHLAKINGYSVIISHRSGETCDTTIADLAVAVNAEYIKTGSLARSERVEKYNRLMEIEKELAGEW